MKSESLSFYDHKVVNDINLAADTDAKLYYKHTPHIYFCQLRTYLYSSIATIHTPQAPTHTNFQIPPSFLTKPPKQSTFPTSQFKHLYVQNPISSAAILSNSDGATRNLHALELGSLVQCRGFQIETTTMLPEFWSTTSWMALPPWG